MTAYPLMAGISCQTLLLNTTMPLRTWTIGTLPEFIYAQLPHVISDPMVRTNVMTTPFLLQELPFPVSQGLKCVRSKGPYHKIFPISLFSFPPDS